MTAIPKEHEQYTFFGRGSGPLVSVLIPSRGSPEGLKKCIRSCTDTMEDKTGNRVEFLVRADDDDPDTAAAAERLGYAGPSHVKCLVGPRRLGYFSIHEFLNELAAQARGDWLLILNDDAVMLTENWDSMLIRVLPGGHTWHLCPQDVFMLFLGCIGNDGFFLGCRDFFLIRRKVYEILGSVCGSPYGDRWLRLIMETLGCCGDAKEIRVRHDRDPDRARCGSELEHLGVNTHHDSDSLYSYVAVTRRMSEVAKLLAHIQEYEARRPWLMGEPKGPGWGRWRPDFNHDPLHMFVRGNGTCVVMAGSPHEVKVADMQPGYWQSR